MKRSARTPSSLSESTNRRLNAYGLAAAAAGVGVLALAPLAQARIVYTPAHRVIKSGQHYDLDVNHDGIIDFTLVNSVQCNTDQCFYDLIEQGKSHNAVIGMTRGSFLPYASALHAGARIGQRRRFVSKNAILGYVYQGGGGTSSRGPWDNVTSRYLGLQFSINGKLHYGWARLNVSISGTTVSAKLTGYAFETIPGKPIIAGKTHGPAGVPTNTGASVTSPMNTPHSASLGLLAMGSPRLSIWRREQSAGARP
jgi:hypothetical protein